MKTAFTCLFLATAAFAAENGNYIYRGSSLPMDHNDDIYNRDFPSLVFNFEQHRRDQPPQVENRQEDLGRYMYRPRTTTPAAPTTRMLDSPKEIPEVKILPEPIRPLPHLIEASTTLKPYIGQTWNQIINKHLPATLPPPPSTPQWMDLSETLKINHHQPHHAPVQPQVIPQAPLYYSEALPQRHAEPLAHPALSQYNVMNTEPEYVPTAKAPYAIGMQDMPTEEYVEHAQSRAASHPLRGHHKFSWGDVTPTEPSPIPTSQAPVPQPHPQPQSLPAQRINPPSSFPTLTPWSGDNFGK